MAKLSDTDLNDKQEAFCREYLIDNNATQAAIRAKYSPKTSDQQGHALLKNPKVQKRINELRKEREERVSISADWVLIKAKESFEFNARQTEDQYGNPKMVNAAAAAKFLELCGKHVAVKAWDKDPAQEPQKDQTITINLVDAVKPDAS